MRRRGDNSLLGPRYRRLTLGVLMVSTFVAFEQMSVATALPAVLRHLGDVGLYGWAFSAFMLGQVVGITLSGPAVDRIGLARPLLAAGAGFSIGLLIDGTAPSMLILVFGRAIQGVGAGVITVILNSALGRSIDDELRPRAFAAMAVAWVLPSIVGPPVAGVVAQDLSWRLVFLGIVPAVAVGLVIAVPALAAADKARRRFGTRYRSRAGVVAHDLDWHCPGKRHGPRAERAWQRSSPRCRAWRGGPGAARLLDPVTAAQVGFRTCL